jgi:hypothetical protein
MKKLLLSIALFISMMVSSQTFTRYYDHVILKDGITRTIDSLEETSTTVVFSGNDKGDIIILTNTGLDLRAERYYKTGRIYDGTSKDGFKYRYIETRNESKQKVIMQLFDIGVFRVHTQKGTYEYQQVPN